MIGFNKSFNIIEKYKEELLFKYKELYPKMKIEEKKEFLGKFEEKVGYIQKQVEHMNAEIYFVENELERESYQSQITVCQTYVTQLQVTLLSEKQKNMDYTIFDENEKRR